MALGNEASLAAGLGTSAIVAVIYQCGLPSIADARVAEPDDQHLASSEKAATWMSAALVGAVTFLTKDPTVFVLGAGTAIYLAWMHKHANQVNPTTGRVASTANSRANVYNASADAGDASGFTPAF
jgi:hypothetical protein